MDTIKEIGGTVLGKVQHGLADAASQAGGGSRRFISTHSDYFDQDDAAFRPTEISQALDSASDKDKIVAMRKLVAMLCKGKDVSELFPDVVKNVVNKNMEIRKSVYMFLEHYAEIEPQKALLAVNSLQKAMADPNQFLRASALRTLSSFKVPDIVQLMVLHVGKAMKDSSPYVRKSSAFAIPKILRLDPRQHNQCVEMISLLLADRNTVVQGATMMVFMEICPHRYDLIHPIFRRLCHVIPDLEEWAQVSVLKLFVYYGRDQFSDPDPEARKKTMQEESSSSTKESGEEVADADDDEEEVLTLLPDHQLMLSSCLPLFHSRNSAVVMGVCVLYYYNAPPNELSKIAPALLRLLHSSREAEYIVLKTVLSLAKTKPSLFASSVPDFFVHTTDPIMIRNLKLDIITFIAAESNIQNILRELRYYVKDEDKEFASMATRAIGRCAIQVPEVAETCMHHLMQLINSNSELVVAESVIVLKTLLQLSRSKSQEAEDRDRSRDERIVRQLTKMLETVHVPLARASIVWVTGEYCEMIPTRAPHVLRTLAKSFIDEEPIVKLQILSLAAKLCLFFREQAETIASYILSLAQFDTSFDVRDRGRLFRTMLFGGSEMFTKHLKRLLITEKPSPNLGGDDEGLSQYIIGSLAHLIRARTSEYDDVPDFPLKVPDPSVRNPPIEEVAAETSPHSKFSETFWDTDEEEGADGSFDDYSGSWRGDEDQEWGTGSFSGDESEELDDWGMPTKKSSKHYKNVESAPSSKEPEVDPLDELFGISEEKDESEPDVPEQATNNKPEQISPSAAEDLLDFDDVKDEVIPQEVSESSKDLVDFEEDTQERVEDPEHV